MSFLSDSFGVIGVAALKYVGKRLIVPLSSLPMHRDAHLIDRIGFAKVVAHFDCSETVVRRWRRKGIPRIHKNPFTLLAQLHGVAA